MPGAVSSLKSLCQTLESPVLHPIRDRTGVALCDCARKDSGGAVHLAGASFLGRLLFK